MRPTRILCARETQKSIQDSVHKLLSDQVQAMGLQSFYEVLESSIRGKNGTEFAFAGIRQQSITSIKSFEGVDICWVEEAQVVTKKSWDVLIPTVRKEKSEIWVTLNPELETDETFDRFIANPPDDAVVIQMNWSDNPWFPDVLMKEKDALKSRDPVAYLNVWEGRCRAAVEGAIYAEEIAASHSRIVNVPYDPALKVHVVFDLGWNDSMSIILAQKGLADIRIIDYIEDDHRTLDSYSAQLKGLNLNWGDLWLPHDGEVKDFKYGKSAQQILEASGWAVNIIPRSSVEEGIRIARMAIPRVYFDKTKTKRLVDCLRHYRRSINQATNEPGQPLHDEYSHGADCFRYLAVSVDQMSNEDWGGALKYPKLNHA